MPGLVFYSLLFLVVGSGFILVHLLAGKLIRPFKPDSEKQTIYECGEPTIGSAWIQFDLRFYVVALLFVIFDVEVAFFFPWAVVFGHANTVANEPANSPRAISARQELFHQIANRGTVLSVEKQTAVEQAAAHQLAWIAFWDIAVFFGVLLVGFAYLWKRGDLDWVRALAAEKMAAAAAADPPGPGKKSVLVNMADDW